MASYALDIEKRRAIVKELNETIIKPMGYVAADCKEKAHEVTQEKLAKAANKAKDIAEAAADACKTYGRDAQYLRSHVVQGDQLWNDIAAEILRVENLAENMRSETANFGRLYKELGESWHNIQGITDEVAHTTTKLEHLKKMAKQHRDGAKALAKDHEALNGAILYLRDDGQYLEELVADAIKIHDGGPTEVD